MVLRRELDADVDAIARLTVAAFGGEAESAIVAGLRSSGALTLSLVAIEDSDIVGHVAFSPVRVGGLDMAWAGLGPISVEPRRQGRGVGAALVRRGLQELHDAGARGCVVLGEPVFYGRFGFRHDLRLTYGATGRHFQALAFTGGVPQGEVSYHAAFS